MKTFSMTDMGRTREMNQDFVFTSEKAIGKLPNLFIVADGMGGHNAGDFASRYAVEVMVREIMQCQEQEPAIVFRRAINKANRELMHKAAEDVNLKGMGTTVVMAALQGNHLWVANVGDSRLYVVGERIRQVTKDHSLVEEMIFRGDLDREAARTHPDKNIITRAVGALEAVEVDIFEEDLTTGEGILMCTDGLSNMLSDDEILTTIRGQRDIAERVVKLVERANDNGGKDNITVIMIEPFSGEVEIC